MIHWRRKLIDAAKAAVTGTPSVGGSVFEWRGHALEAKHKRWIVVIPRSEAPGDDSTQSEQDVVFSLDFVASGRDPEMRDQVSLEMQEAIERSPIAHLLLWTGTSLGDPDVSGDAAIFEATHSYNIRYSHPFESPGTD